MKPPLTILDLDKTVLRIDSLRALVLQHWYRPALAGLLLKRLLKLVPASAIHEHIVRHRARYLPDDAAVQRFCDALLRQQDPVILEFVTRHAPGTRLILLSASPEWYVAPLAKRLGMTGYGSTLAADGTFLYCHGNGKLSRLYALFPKAENHYELGIGDHESDRLWLVHCLKAYLYRDGKFLPASMV